ncbi:MAG: hypothetical protein NT075_15640 [Chloroflexi bacterium]|nr:hypothetical protein [Chloroflexota bacterium]
MATQLVTALAVAGAQANTCTTSDNAGKFTCQLQAGTFEVTGTDSNHKLQIVPQTIVVAEGNVPTVNLVAFKPTSLDDTDEPQRRLYLPLINR